VTALLATLTPDERDAFFQYGKIMMSKGCLDVSTAS
jgi:hypothetical protein